MKKALLKFIIVILLISLVGFSKITVFASPKIKSIPSINLSIYQDKTFKLPKTVTVILSNNTKKNMTVIWNVKTVDTKKTGTYKYYGMVKGYSKRVTLSLIIKATLPTILPIDDIYKTVFEGNTYNLPETITVKMSDGTNKEVNVSWNITSVNTSKSGTYEFYGKIDKYNKEIILYLTVKDNIPSSVDDINETIIQGDIYNLPQTVKAKMSNGTTKEVNVIWEASSVNTDVPGEYSFYGTAKGYDIKVSLKLTIKTDELNKNVVTFKDKYFEEAVRKAINIPSRVIYKNDIYNIYQLNLLNYEKSKKISDISGIENFSNLTTLSLEDTEISDITPLSKLTKLYNLTIDYSKVNDLNSLKGLTNLSYLSLDYNQIDNINALNGLVNLHCLSLNYNKITDITPLSLLNKIDTLFLQGNQIDNSSINVLKELTKLIQLDLGRNKITDLSFLSKLTKLQSLYLYNNQISDITPLSSLKNLKELDLDYNQLNNINTLKDLPSLTFLQLSENKITDITVLKDLSNLKYLSIGYNPISNLNILKSMSNCNIDLLDNSLGLDKAIEVYNKADEILKSIITPGMSDLQKEKAIHDYIVLNAEYDYVNLINNTLSQDSYCEYGILIKGTGVCTGYALATKFLLSRVGIECYLVRGKADNGTISGHAWNIVKIDGKYYHIDTTWDDPIPDTKGHIEYNYFNLTDSQISKDHFWNTNSYPKCD